jgi:membrane protein
LLAARPPDLRSRSTAQEEAFSTDGPAAFAALVETLLAESPYPVGFPRTVRVLFVSESRELLIDYDLSRQDVIPDNDASPRDEPVVLAVWSPAASAPAGLAGPITGLPHRCVPPGLSAWQDWRCSPRRPANAVYFDNQAPEESSVMVQPDHQDRQLATAREVPVSRSGVGSALSAARVRFRRSLAGSFVRQLRALDFANQAMLFGAGLLVSLLPFVILLSAFASQRVDDDISLRLGLDRRAAGIVDHLITSAPATVNAATITSLIFVTAGMFAVASSLQQIYEKAFHQDNRGLRDWYRLLAWIVVLCAAVVLESVAAGAARKGPAGGWLGPLVTVAIMGLFFWWTMDFLLAGRVPWSRLLPSAIVTGVFYGGLGVFSRFYFSGTIISDSKTYGTIGAIFGIMTWLIAIGAVIILGAVAGAVWEERRDHSKIPGSS